MRFYGTVAVHATRCVDFHGSWRAATERGVSAAVMIAVDASTLAGSATGLKVKAPTVH